MTRLPRWLALLVALAVVAAAGPAWAGASRVAIVRPGRSNAAIDEATTRLSAELRAAGFEVVVVDATPGTDARSQVEATHIDPRPFATIAILGTERGAVADVWVADHLSAKTLVRRVDVADAAAAGAPGALAIRAVELLRASLLEIGARPSSGAVPLPADVARWMGQVAPPAPPIAPVPPPGPPLFPVIAIAPPAAPPAPAPRPGVGGVPTGPERVAPSAPDRGPPARRGARPGVLEPTAIEGGGALLQSFGGIGPALAPALRISHGGPLGLVGRVSFVGPALGGQLQSAAGSASLHQELLELELLYPILSGESDLVPIVSLGIGGHHLGAQGRGSSQAYSGLSQDAWAFAADIGAGVAARLSDEVALLFDVHGVALVPDPIIRIAGEEVGRSGFPVLLTSIGVVLAF